MVFPWHRELDAQREVRKGQGKIGTTKRGIGPTYGDKAARVGLRMIDLLNPQRFPERLRERLEENNEVLKALGAQPLSTTTPPFWRTTRAAADRLRPFVTNTVRLPPAMPPARQQHPASKAPRAPSSTSTTAPTPTSPRPTPPPAAPAPAPASPPTAWTASWA